MTQYDRLAKLLTRKRGCTAMDIVERCGSVAPHKRLSELKERGWRIWREAVKGKNYGRYFGRAPSTR